MMRCLVIVGALLLMEISCFGDLRALLPILSLFWGILGH